MPLPQLADLDSVGMGLQGLAAPAVPVRQASARSRRQDGAEPARRDSLTPTKSKRRAPAKAADNKPTMSLLYDANNMPRRRSLRLTKEALAEDHGSGVQNGRLRHPQRISPEGASLARSGRQFTVGNIGNNGRIYLR